MNSTAPALDLQDSVPEEPELSATDIGQPSDLSERERNWLEDIEFLRNACKNEHIDPFYLCSVEEFDFKLDQLATKAGELSDSDIAFEIASVVTDLGDTHSCVTLPQPVYDRRFPVGVRYFGDKLYLTAYREGFEQFESYLLFRRWNCAEYVDGENGGCVFLALTNIMPGYGHEVRHTVQEAGDVFQSHPECNKLVIDLRNYPGGNADFVQYFREVSPNRLKTDHTYVLTGGMTAFAAMTFIAFFQKPDERSDRRRAYGTISNHVPYAGFRRGTGHSPTFTNLRLLSNAWWDSAADMPERVGVSPVFDEYYDENGRLYEWENTVLPDVFVFQDSEDIRRGKDSVIEWMPHNNDQGITEIARRNYPAYSEVGCAATCVNNFVIDASGLFYTCWNYFGETSKRIGSLDEPDKIRLSGDYFNWLTIPTPEKCKECVYLPICQSGCPDYRIRNQNEPVCGFRTHMYTENIKLSFHNYVA